jgi:cysteine desulfurase
MKKIYLDNAATTKIDDRVLEAMMPYLKDSFGNASSVHSIGRETKVLLEDARETIANFIGAKPAEIYFTSGGTEANNFALKGIAFNNLGSRSHIISTPIEHSAVRDSLEYLKQRFGFEVTFIPVNKYGEADLDYLRDAITDKTFLVCVMHSNNELGVINDIAKISEIIGDGKITLHTDSVQSIGKTNFNVNKINCSTATLSAHKIYGPKGIGALYIRKGTSTDKFIHGGKQERDRRGGTENIHAIAGFKKAIEILNGQMDSDIVHYKKLKDYFISKLNSEFGGKIIINSKASENSLPNIVNVSFKGNIDSDTIIIKLDMKGIAVSSGSACTSGAVQPSHVLKAIGYNDEAAKSSFRISFGRENKTEEIDYLMEALREIMNS